MDDGTDQPPWLAGKPPADVEVPDAVRRVAGDVALDPIWQNELGGLTFAAGTEAERVFIKWARHDTGLDLEAEAQRLRWAHPFTPVPTVVEFHAYDVESVLVTAAMPGESAVSDRWKRDPETAVRAIGTQLRRAHDALPVDRCPYRWTVESRLAAKSADALRLPPAPAVDRLVVCHGDACAPNTLVGDDGQPVGIVDLGTLGVGDRWGDLAVATWSTEWNYGPGWEAALLDAYGIEPDPERTEYYRLLWDAT